MERRPVVAGQFYPGSRSALEEEVEKLLNTGAKPRKVLAAIAPHAGYVYSGAVAGAVFASAEVPKRCIVLSPNHTGLGTRAAVWTRGSWGIPTGTIAVDEPLAGALMRRCSELSEDTSAHAGEHSLEVLLPFLLARQPKLSIVPITLSHLNVSSCKKIGDAIAGAIREEKEDILIVASTDMNHYEEQERTMKKDRMAIERVLALDAEGLLTTCGENRISMCGVVPTAVAIYACKELGAKKATLIKHTTSGEVSGDFSAVVGYAGFVIE
ncbi:MAG: AmmeMemoRadiSam system protein B [Pseudomonadota bacterium]